MKSILVSLVVIAFTASAFAGPGHGHGGPGYGRGPGHGGHHGPPHHGGRHDDNDAGLIAAIFLSVSGVLLTSSTACDSSQSCAYKQIIADSKDDAAVYIATEGDVKGVKLVRSLELLRNLAPEVESSDMELAEEIINW
ncbi:DUF2388 domain-containing protein [Bdellovibrio sp. SKB1291214]|uniref:DUF2388 domain-containing protein n=1 Tax=Bdellovibrio sp. SKB1291214 TaxID=1732569 RepID=UPI000B515ABD|nr:DUF2388 domain-containing protein [Bdellovibrio sp. SKB1291214]UYL10126.1 DUF2388 domain-containing protein [Bdellovibrio sp. SKB1291214]